MPNGRSDEFMLRKKELVRLLQDSKEAMLRTKLPPAAPYEIKTKPAADLVAVVEQHPEDQIYVEEIDYCCYRIFLGPKQEGWIYVEARQYGENSAEHDLFYVLRQHHLVRSMNAKHLRHRGDVEEI